MTEDPLWRSVGGVYECDGHFHAFCVLRPVALKHPTKYRVFLGPPALYEADAMAESIVIGRALWETMRLRPVVLPVLVGWDLFDVEDPTVPLGEDVGSVAVKALEEVEGFPSLDLREEVDFKFTSPGGDA